MVWATLVAVLKLHNPRVHGAMVLGIHVRRELVDRSPVLGGVLLQRALVQLVDDLHVGQVVEFLDRDDVDPARGLPHGVLEVRTTPAHPQAQQDHENRQC